MAGSWIRLGGVLLLMASLAAGCGSGRDVGDGESELIDGYLEPLRNAGIPATVERACHRGECGVGRVAKGTTAEHQVRIRPSCGSNA
jgi:hypothetical protein